MGGSFEGRRVEAAHGELYRGGIGESRGEEQPLFEEPPTWGGEMEPFIEEGKDHGDQGGRMDEEARRDTVLTARIMNPSWKLSPLTHLRWSDHVSRIGSVSSSRAGS